ncbi:ABC transporter permease [Mesorhizobium sp.]|uniref:ABC transporter permease n=1 Tax=Mesorhizobium sp. TaxID=1871066 RepID=UPI000FE7CFF4|nr:ABC transporter permease [Mesorhizobium sp.]RWI23963.1 MAG: ABC transporter permease [Mesorhizobium sp.]RWK51514.1 MAG: ABC transporter permease [Mesorhizobium sp.]RWK83622.1 MAG: ABC transporter permease [Mesorhizobium sp.]RWK96177.1 MAG: ABC transporter permease [Mesorhizobium sp.]TIP59834.1 MAG: ABC transporter permease [Mesorhizobium sp.]
MLAYLTKSIVGAVVVLLVMSFIVFGLQSIIPADPARAIAGPSAPPQTVEAMREHLGLEDPVLVQYGRFLLRLSRADLGTSVRTRQPVFDDIREYLPATLELGLASIALGVALAGVMAALQFLIPGSGGIRFAIVGIGSTPIFLSALLLAYFFWFRLDWLPGAGRLAYRDFAGPTGLYVIDGLLVGRPEVSIDALLHTILPALALALPIGVAVGRSLNGALHEVMRQTYIRTARGKGLSETKVLLRHGLRNAATAPLSMLRLQVPILFGNLLVVERVFGWPGLGLYTVQAFASADLPAVLGVAIVFGILYILISTLIEIGQSMADSRINL